MATLMFLIIVAIAGTIMASNIFFDDDDWRGFP